MAHSACGKFGRTMGTRLRHSAGPRQSPDAAIETFVPRQLQCDGV
jgi:hypothetical protein